MTGQDPDGEPAEGPLFPAGPAGEEHGADALRATRRWAFSFPAAVLAACLLCGCTAAVFLLRDQTPVPVSSVDLPTAGPLPSGDGAPPGETGEPGTVGSPGTEKPPATVAAGTGTESATAGTVVVHVAGAVQRPGVVRLPAGSRIVDAVDAAGGTAADVDLAAVNLAAVLEDGAMVLVPRIGEAAVPPGGEMTGIPGPGTASGTPAGPGSAAAVNLNTADSDRLQTLPRVGPVLAERIIAWRTEHGKFTRPEDLDAVPGIGEAMLAALLPLVAV